MRPMGMPTDQRPVPSIQVRAHGGPPRAPLTRPDGLGHLPHVPTVRSAAAAADFRFGRLRQQRPGRRGSALQSRLASSNTGTSAGCVRTSTPRSVSPHRGAGNRLVVQARRDRYRRLRDRTAALFQGGDRLVDVRIQVSEGLRVDVGGACSNDAMGMPPFLVLVSPARQNGSPICASPWVSPVVPGGLGGPGPLYVHGDYPPGAALHRPTRVPPPGRTPRPATRPRRPASPAGLAVRRGRRPAGPVFTEPRRGKPQRLAGAQRAGREDQRASREEPPSRSEPPRRSRCRPHGWTGGSPDICRSP
jgi:hypothetical protein